MDMICSIETTVLRSNLMREYVSRPFSEGDRATEEALPRKLIQKYKMNIPLIPPKAVSAGICIDDVSTCLISRREESIRHIGLSWWPRDQSVEAFSSGLCFLALAIPGTASISLHAVSSVCLGLAMFALIHRKRSQAIRQ